MTKNNVNSDRQKFRQEQTRLSAKDNKLHPQKQ